MIVFGKAVIASFVGRLVVWMHPVNSHAKNLNLVGSLTFFTTKQRYHIRSVFASCQMPYTADVSEVAGHVTMVSACRTESESFSNNSAI